jgi:hypothetical protein
MARKGFDLEKAVEGFMTRMDEEQEQQGEQEATQEAETPVKVAKRKKDVVVSFRLDEAVVERFNDYAFYKRVSKKEALQTIITEYLDGRGLDEDSRRVLERVSKLFEGEK